MALVHELSLSTEKTDAQNTTLRAHAARNRQPSLAGTVCAFGVFDGLHQGHQALITEAETIAHDAGCPSAILTFTVDPDSLFCPDSLKKLASDEQRIAMLAACAVDDVFVIPFTRQVASLTPEHFLRLAFGAQTPAALVVGEDFRFGYRAQGNVAMLAEWGKLHDMEVVAVPLLSIDGAPVTSTRIRALLAAGNITEANRLLGRPFTVTGRVQQGAHKGAELGFRTANLELPEMMTVLGDGVYTAYATVSGTQYRSAVSVGLPPTFAGERTANVEAHLLDFDGNLYGDEITLAFKQRLRPMQKFSSEEELISAVTADFDAARRLPLEPDC